MNIRPTRAPDCQDIDCNDPEYSAPSSAIMIEGVHFLPVDDISLGSCRDQHGHMHGLILMKLQGMGLNKALSPAGLRTLAEKMNHIAQLIEDEAGGGIVRRLCARSRKAPDMSRILATLEPSDAWAMLPFILIIVGACLA